MNGRVAKQLRKICPPMNAFTRRVYRKLKSQYKSLPHYARRDFIELLKEKTIQAIAQIRITPDAQARMLAFLGTTNRKESS